MKTPSKKFYLEFSFKNQLFRFSKILIFFEKFIFFENMFSPWWNNIFCSDFFCDQVCICTNPRNHLEHLPCSHGDSEPPAVHILDQFLLWFSGFREFWAGRWSPKPVQRDTKSKSFNANFFYVDFIDVIDRFQHAEHDFGIWGSGSAIL